MPKDTSEDSGQNKEEAQGNKIICGRCGTPMGIWQCRYICKNCGYMSTCSEENIFHDY